MRKTFRGVIPILLCIILTLCACSKKENTTTFTGDTSTEPPYQDNLNAISPAAYGNVQGLSLEPGTYISIIGKDSSSAYWNEIKAGVEQAAVDINKALGYGGTTKIKVSYNAPAEVDNIDEQVNILDEELARYPDAIGVASIDEDACKMQFDLATENGIPIVAFDSGNTYQGIQSTCKTDNLDAARTGAYKLCDEIEDAGEILLLVHDSKSDSAKERVSSFQNEIETNHPEVTIARTIYCDQMDELKKEIAEEKNSGKANDAEKIKTDDITDEDVIAYYLDKHPDVKGIFGTNVTATQLALSVLRDQKMTDDIVLMGFDAGKTQTEALEKGEIKGLVVQNPFGMGYAAVVAAARTVLQIGNEATVNTGYIWVTKDNMSEPSIQNMLYE